MVSLIFKKLLGTKKFFYFLFGLCFTIIISVVFVSLNYDISLGIFTRDPVAITKGLPYYGFISNIGVIFWSFTLGIMLFSMVLLQSKDHIEKKYISFLFIGILISFLMLMDDLFLAHEFIYPYLFRFDEKVTFGFYGVLILYYLINFRNIIYKETNYIFLGLSLLFFGTSIICDTLTSQENDWRYFYEDIPKFIGIFCWFGYHAQVSKDLLMKSPK